MTLTNLSEAELIASAGGDPWAINQSLQAGNPSQIDRLAEAFHNAGRCTAAASEEFAQARKRFEAAWNHEGGAHPINESEEVQQVTKSLGYQSEQLPKIGLDLENVATALAAAQRAGAQEIAALDRQLHVLDLLIGAAKKDLTFPLPATERDKLEKLINDAHADAVDDVRDALKQMQLIRGLYTDVLDNSRGTLARDGYAPSLIWGVDGHQPQRPAPHGLGPSIDGPATPPKMEGINTGKQDDLDVSIPGTGIALGGDGKDDSDGFPRIHVPGVYDGKNPLPVPKGTRPLPTGTAVGPNGEHYGFYAIVPYQNPDGSPNKSYTSPDTVVVDLAHPDTPLYTLHGISQASGAYDAKSGRMVILGNTPDGQRALWQSAPVNQNRAWGNSLQQQGTFSGSMNGNRESQIVALPKGGMMVVGAGETPDHRTLPIQAVTASTPQGLLTATPTALVQPETLHQVYGPTITGIQEINGKEVVSMRVSTYGDGHYDPHTYTTTFTVTPGS
ncbi:hypothetical protein A5653_02770 [Mycobacterium colombiense]|uniref:putative alpha/beta hydrolase n=1 Tax=Mycobacterium colombiense TaxID=339268 RepID=UPI0007EEFB71|nr:chorismate mutase [Mycobacterium colombiense]OBK65851.1 hypothetical protein A5653_02770 [Mycobacterium colombiense]